MKLFRRAKTAVGLAFAVTVVLMAAPVQAQTFATTTIGGSPGVGYAFTYTIETKSHKKLPSPSPFIDIQYAVPGHPFTDYLNSDNGSFKLGMNGKTCTIGSYWKFSTGTSTVNLEFISKDTDLTLKSVKAQAYAANLPIIRLNAKSAGHYKVTLIVSGVEAGPQIPDPLPTFTVLARGPGISENSGAVQASTTSTSQTLQLNFDLNVKKPGPITVVVQSPFRYLLLVSEGSYNTDSLGHMVKLNLHNSF